MKNYISRNAQNEEVLERISRMRYFDDELMTVAFEDFIEGAELVIHTILNKNSLKVISVKTQMQVVSFTNRSIRLDILATDENNKLYDIEIQRSDAGASEKRSRYHSSAIDLKYLEKGSDFNELPETYVIFITENDVLGHNKPIYFIERTIIGLDTLFGDEEHIIYVNGAYEDDTTELGKLIHDFLCENPDDMKFQVLADRARYCKESEEGVRKVSRIVEEYGEELKKAKTIEIARNMLKRGKNTVAEIAEDTGLTIEEVNSLKGTFTA